MAHAPHLAPAGRVEATAASPVLHAAQIPEVAAARHAVANSILDSAEAVHDESSAVADVALVDPKSRGRTSFARCGRMSCTHRRADFSLEERRIRGRSREPRCDAGPRVAAYAWLVRENWADRPPASMSASIDGSAFPYRVPGAHPASSKPIGSPIRWRQRLAARGLRAGERIVMGRRFHRGHRASRGPAGGSACRRGVGSAGSTRSPAQELTAPHDAQGERPSLDPDRLPRMQWAGCVRAARSGRRPCGERDPSVAHRWVRRLGLDGRARDRRPLR